MRQIYVTPDEVSESFVGYRQADYDKTTETNFDDDDITIKTHKKYATDITKERRSTDLLYKGLQLYLFDKNNLNAKDNEFINNDKESQSQTSKPIGTISFKRSGNFADFPESNNFNKLIIDLTKIAAFNETVNEEYDNIDIDNPINENEKDFLNEKLKYLPFDDDLTHFEFNKTNEKRENKMPFIIIYPDDTIDQENENGTVNTDRADTFL